ncbi:hypothetical protein HDV05_005737 [Chytridiales sp. JEL 0842]|nr:hypothetical protein HDV05_005737 [Chytridiales sp. JEL 0842]
MNDHVRDDEGNNATATHPSQGHPHTPNQPFNTLEQHPKQYPTSLERPIQPEKVKEKRLSLPPFNLKPPAHPLHPQRDLPIPLVPEPLKQRSSFGSRRTSTDSRSYKRFSAGSSFHKQQHQQMIKSARRHFTFHSFGQGSRTSWSSMVSSVVSVVGSKENGAAVLEFLKVWDTDFDDDDDEGRGRIGATTADEEETALGILLKDFVNEEVDFSSEDDDDEEEGYDGFMFTAASRVEAPTMLSLLSLNAVQQPTNSNTQETPPRPSLSNSIRRFLRPLSLPPIEKRWSVWDTMVTRFHSLKRDHTKVGAVAT